LGQRLRSNLAPEFLALNPNGLVPVIVDGDLVLWAGDTISREAGAARPAPGQGRPRSHRPCFSLADTVLGLSTNRWLMTPMTRPELRAVRAWYGRLTARPAFRRHGCNAIP
jgi:glutathione S-transferase